MKPSLPQKSTLPTSAPEISNTKLVELLKTYWAWRRLWVATTIVFGAAGLLYVYLLKTDAWVASQGLIVRDEANGAVMRLGRFQSQTEMKAAQETILEMARNTQVLREALLEVGPDKNLLGSTKMSGSWPSQRDVAELADDSIGVRAPKGAEFGTTEVIYLDVKQSARQRAVELNLAVCKALDSRLRQVRVARAEGVIEELVRATNMASEELQKVTAQLQAIEREAGADLADLRGLSENNVGGNTSRQQLETLSTELRQIENQHASLVTDLTLLRETQVNPERILSAPASILSAHPGLRKLREGLADAQLNTSQLRSRYENNHPLVYVSHTTEMEIKLQLQGELALALSTANRDVENSQRRIDVLKQQQQQLEERLQRLARVRVEHDKVNQEVRARTRILQDAERQLADTQAARDAALTTSLLTRIDEPVIGEKPVGPGRTMILAAAMVAGLFFGLGIVFLLTPLDGSAPSEERWNERLGRRLSDRFPWLADQTPANGPRRRRSDVERRQGNRGTEANRNSWLGRRQSDRQNPAASNSGSSSAIASQSVAAIVQSEDPSVITRLDQMLLSELSSVVPTQAATPDPADVPVIQPTSDTESLPTLDQNKSSVLDSPASENESLADQLSENLHMANALTAVQSVRKPVKPRQVGNKAPSPLRNTTQKQAAITESALPVEKQPVPTTPIQPISVLPTPIPPTPIPPTLAQPTLAPPQSAPPAAPSVTAEPNAALESKPSPEKPSPEKPTVDSTPVEAAETPRASKPGANMFRPNQALSQGSVPEREAQRPRRADGQSKPQAAPTPTSPLPPVFPCNAFETPAEGGLAGIGLPTQPLPESFPFRQS